MDNIRSCGDGDAAGRGLGRQGRGGNVSCGGSAGRSHCSGNSFADSGGSNMGHLVDFGDIATCSGAGGGLGGGLSGDASSGTDTTYVTRRSRTPPLDVGSQSEGHEYVRGCATTHSSGMSALAARSSLACETPPGTHAAAATSWYRGGKRVGVTSSSDEGSLPSCYTARRAAALASEASSDRRGGDVRDGVGDSHGRLHSRALASSDVNQCLRQYNVADALRSVGRHVDSDDCDFDEDDMAKESFLSGRRVPTEASAAPRGDVRGSFGGWEQLQQTIAGALSSSSSGEGGGGGGRKSRETCSSGGRAGSTGSIFESVASGMLSSFAPGSSALSSAESAALEGVGSTRRGACSDGSSVMSSDGDQDEVRRQACVIGPTPSLMLAGCTITLEDLLREARKPFGQLLIETPDAPVLLEEGEFGLAFGQEAQSCGSRAGRREAGSPLLQAVVRDRLIGHVLGCCSAASRELLPQEANLWHAFVAADVNIRGALCINDANFERVFDCFAADSPEILDSWVGSVAERANAEGEIDFADLLDWSVNERRAEERWSLPSSLRRGLSQLFGGAPPEESPQGVPEDIVNELRHRCVRASPLRLAEAATAYQRSLVLTHCWRCEHHLRNMLSTVVIGAGRNDGVRGRPPGSAAGLLVVLRAIHAELAPSERVIWEYFGSTDSNFDGALSKGEVLEAIRRLVSEAETQKIPEAADANMSPKKLKELQRLQSDCQRESIEALFEAGGKRTVSLADILRWWWDMPEEYRVAVGLTVPVAMLRRGFKRQPEEMFHVHLRRVAASAGPAKVSLRGHVRAFAELRALCARRAIEGLHSCPPTESRTTSTSDFEGSSQGARDVEEEGAVAEHE